MSKEEFSQAGMGTRAVWAGEREQRSHRATQVPVVLSVAFGYTDMDEWYDVSMGRKPGHIYSRNTNPTVAAFEDKMAVLEGAEAATSFSTGMAAISNTLYTFLRPGDRVVSVKDTYGGTNKIFTEFLPQINVEAVLCNTGDHEEMEAEIRKGCQLVYIESPTNPTIKITDIARIAQAGRTAGAVVVVDNTFATPINQNPLQMGADLVLHSATKFLGGHADALGGVVCGPRNLIEAIYHYREVNGATLAPMEAYLLLRGIKTLKLRIDQATRSAAEIAKFLVQQPLVESVYYPGLATHKNHDIARKQMRGFGGMVSFALKGGMDSVSILLPRLQYANCAANLGSVETTYGPARTTSHVECTAEERRALGIPDGLVRISVGIEDTGDLVADLKQAFEYLNKRVQL